MNNTLAGINSRITEAEEQINDLEDRMVEITAAEQNIKKKEWKEMKTAWETCGAALNTPTFALQGSQKEDREKERTWENIWRDKSSKLPDMEKEIVNQVQEAQKVPSRINPRRNTPRHTVITLTRNFFFIRQTMCYIVRCKETWMFVEFIIFIHVIQNSHQDIFRCWCFC